MTTSLFRCGSLAVTNRRSAMNKILISAGDVSLEAELNDSPTARQIWEALPIVGTAQTWGDEIYFEIPVQA
ncbi:MAG TPA: cyclophilin-like family protein, partial [Anaerolineae bacterium]|nr:cyclophilin-like family protein [Anaerolineae bacterium]